jgi:hypothetical protein
MKENILNRVKLLMKYDLKKTYKENLILVEEVDAQNKIILDQLKIAVAYGGTKEKELIDAISKIKDLNQLKVIETNLKPYTGYNTFQEMFNGELYYGDANTANSIKNIFSKLGVKMSFNQGPNYVNKFKVEIPTPATKSTERQDNINYIYCSVRKNIITAKGSQEGVKWDDYVNTYKLTVDEIEVARKYCASKPVTEYPEKSSNAGGTKTGTKTKTVAAPPEFLKDTKGVMAFQDWLDTNKKGWYKGGELNKGRGYGSFGSNTTKAWNSYKDEYMKNKTSGPEIKKITGQTTTQTTTNVTPSITTNLKVPTAPTLTRPNVSGADLYTTLYNNGNIEGAGQNRIKLKVGISPTPENLTKLDEYLSTLGYSRIKQETEKTYGSKYVWSK